MRGGLGRGGGMRVWGLRRRGREASMMSDGVMRRWMYEGVVLYHTYANAFYGISFGSDDWSVWVLSECRNAADVMLR